MIQVIQGSKDAIQVQIQAMNIRRGEADAAISRTAAEIMEDVRRRGYEAVREYSLQFDKAEPYELTKDQLEAAAAACPQDLYAAMVRSAENIRDYQARLLPQSSQWQVGQGSMLGQRVRGLHRVGIYVPGGRAAYPSSVLMNAIPAKVAGVEEIIMVTPPTENLNNAVMAAAQIAGVDRVIALGGIQAVAALTYGVGFVPRVDKLVGPGNAYVAAAKRLAFGQLDIDMVAGPSEVLVIADETADPVYVAADLLSQAEHDMMASAVLVTDSSALADAVARELERQTAYLERREVMERSLMDYGAIIVCADLDQACAIANEIAPEHLEIMTKSPEDLLPQIQNAGAIFLGRYSPEPLGDYMAGPSHVLPTSGTARFFSPLSVDSFLKKTSVIAYAREDLEAVHDAIEIFAQAEGLTAHANSIAVRFPDAGERGNDQ